MLYKIGVYKTFAKFTGKQEPHFNKVTGAYPGALLKEKALIQVFFDEFCEIFKTAFLQDMSRRLLLGKNNLPIN